MAEWGLFKIIYSDSCYTQLNFEHWISLWSWAWKIKQQTNRRAIPASEYYDWNMLSKSTTFSFNIETGLLLRFIYAPQLDCVVLAEALPFCKTVIWFTTTLRHSHPNDNQYKHGWMYVRSTLCSFEIRPAEICDVFNCISFPAGITVDVRWAIPYMLDIISWFVVWRDKCVKRSHVQRFICPVFNCTFGNHSNQRYFIVIWFNIVLLVRVLL